VLSIPDVISKVDELDAVVVEIKVIPPVPVAFDDKSISYFMLAYVAIMLSRKV